MVRAYRCQSVNEAAFSLSKSYAIPKPPNRSVNPDAAPAGGAAPITGTLAFMFIDQIFPAVVGGKSSLRERLIVEALAQGFSNEHANAIVSMVPERLISSGCFLDKMTGLWRYEFGAPYNIAQDLVWGTHMWVPVNCLFAALSCAYSRLPEGKRVSYLERLADPDGH